MKSRREFITLLGGTAAAWPLAVRAQQAAMPVVRTEKLDSDVLVMKPADQGMRHDAANPLTRARDRRIFVQ